MLNSKLKMIVVGILFFCITLLSLSTLCFGDNWELVDPGTVNVGNVYFTDKLHGVATGVVGSGFVFGGLDKPAIVWTDDGGETWNEGKADIDLKEFYLPGLWFSNNNTGWITGSKGPDKSILLKTEDGGKNWKNINLLSAIKNIGQIWFDRDGKYGWINTYAGYIWNTENYGETWQQINVPSVNSHSGFFAFSFEHIVLAGNSGFILITEDAGKTWYTVKNDLDGEDASLCAVHFAPDGKSGWAVGAEGKRVVNSGWVQLKEPVVLHTTDEGKTWKKQSVKVKSRLTDVWTISSDEAWIVSFGGYALPNFIGSSILHTTDGGETWLDESQNQISWRKIFFIDNNHGWVVGGQAGSPYEPAGAMLIYEGE